MRILSILAASTALVAGASAASAQSAPEGSNGTSFRGFRVEGNVGWNKFQSQGTNNEKLGYGGAAGFDGVIADRVVIGPEVSYWHPDKGGTVNSTVNATGTSRIDQRSGDEWGAAVRVGVLASPNLMVYGRGGYASNYQVRTVTTTLPAGTVRDTGHVDGYQVGGGAEYTIGDKLAGLGSGVYVSAQYVYSRYDNHTSRQRAMAGFGVRFK